MIAADELSTEGASATVAIVSMQFASGPFY